MKKQLVLSLLLISLLPASALAVGSLSIEEEVEKNKLAEQKKQAEIRKIRQKNKVIRKRRLVFTKLYNKMTNNKEIILREKVLLPNIKNKELHQVIERLLDEPVAATEDQVAKVVHTILTRALEKKELNKKQVTKTKPLLKILITLATFSRQKKVL